MPIYEYACRSCDERFEKLERSMHSADPSPPCPACGSAETGRALSVFAVANGEGKSSGGDALPPGMCGRCGGPGPCGM